MADRELNAAPQWDLVDGECDVVVVDPDADHGPEALAARPFGALVVLALRPGETAWPGTLSLARPFDPRQVDLTLSLAAQIIIQPAFAAQAPPTPPPAANMTTGADLEELPSTGDEPVVDAPEFAEAVEEAAASEEARAIADEVAELEAATRAEADAEAIQQALETEPSEDTAEVAPALESLALDTTEDEPAATSAEAEDDGEPSASAGASPFDVPTLQGDADDAAIDRLAMAVMDDTTPPDEADAEPDPPAMDEAIVDLSADSDESIELLEFPGTSGTDQLSEFADDGSDDAAEDEGVMLSTDFEDADAVLADAVQAEAGFPKAEERPGPFDDLKAPAQPEPEFEPLAEPEHEPAAEVQEPEPQAEPVAAAPDEAEEFPEPTVALDDVGSLADLATAYREQLYRERHVVIHLDGHVFHLEPYAGECFSTSPARILEAYRGHGNLDIAIAIEEAPADDRPGEKVRLVDFLWQLGFHAGNAALLPWVDPEARYRVTRQPPMDEDAKETGVLQVAQLISRTPVAVPDMAHLAGAPEAVVNDFLNGCSLVGYLERVAHPVRRRPDADPAARRGQASPSLIGSLRRRIGLQK